MHIPTCAINNFDAITPHTTFFKGLVQVIPLSPQQKSPYVSLPYGSSLLKQLQKLSLRRLHPYGFQGIVIINTRFQLNENQNSSGIPCCFQPLALGPYKCRGHTATFLCLCSGPRTSEEDIRQHFIPLYWAHDKNQYL